MLYQLINDRLFSLAKVQGFSVPKAVKYLSLLQSLMNILLFGSIIISKDKAAVITKEKVKG